MANTGYNHLRVTNTVK